MKLFGNRGSMRRSRLKKRKRGGDVITVSPTGPAVLTRHNKG